MFLNKRELDSIDIKKLLIKYGAKSIRLSGDVNFLTNCFFHKDQKPSFAICFKGKRKGRFICYSGKCGATGDLLTFVSMIEGIDRKDALEAIKEEIDFKKSYNIKRIKNRLKNLNKGKKKKEKKIRKIKSFVEHKQVLSFENQIPELSNYLVKVRKYKNDADVEKIVKKFNIQIVDHRWIGMSICIPVVFDNKIVSYYYEDLNDRSIKRYSKGSKVTRYLFNFRKKECKRMILVEGIWDVIKVWSIGFESVTSCFSSKVSMIQTNLLNKYIDQVLVFFDGDEAGRKGAKSAMENIEPGSDVILIETPNHKDPGEMTRKAIKALILS